MSAWERWSKRIVKGLCWAIIIVPLAGYLEILLTWQLVIFVFVGIVWDYILEAILPTDESSAAKAKEPVK